MAEKLEEGVSEGMKPKVEGGRRRGQVGPQVPGVGVVVVLVKVEEGEGEREQVKQ